MTGAMPFAPRSLLFVPATQPALLPKVSRWSPDAVVVDLEDAVPADRKDEGRSLAVEAIRALPEAGTVVLLRVNPPITPWYGDDVTAAVAAGVSGIVLPKYDSRDHHSAARNDLDRAGGPSLSVTGGIETALGVANVRELAAGGVDAVYFGAEDYTADLGGERGDDNAEVLYARSKVALAGRVAGIPTIDQAVVAVRDHARYEREALEARRLGYSGKICIHPDQVRLAHRAFTPTDEQVAHARAVIRAATDGVSVLDGQMIDEVHRRMAQRLLQKASVAEADRGSSDL